MQRRDFLEFSLGVTLVGRSGNVSVQTPSLGSEPRNGGPTDSASVVARPSERRPASSGIEVKWSELTRAEADESRHPGCLAVGDKPPTCVETPELVAAVGGMPGS